MAAGSELLRGGGSLGLPAPSGWKRQPSVTVDFTRDDAGPRFEYVHPALVPCQYDQYAYLLPCWSPQPVEGTPSMAHSSPVDWSNLTEWPLAITSAPLSVESAATHIVLTPPASPKSTTTATDAGAYAHGAVVLA